ncbi:MAG: Rrf2 family transcriptional regulator [Planctomycetota bacterium]
MKLSTRARYALRMTLDIARNHGGESPVSLSGVSQRTSISHGYLEQLAQALRNAGILRGVSGRHGGYRLARPPAEISVGQVIEAAIGRVCLLDCLGDSEVCPNSDDCEPRALYVLINRGITDVIHRYTLADLLDPSWIEEVGSADPFSDGSKAAAPSPSGKKCV